MSESGQVSTKAAEIYEEQFVPALFGQWPPKLIEAAGIAPGQRVLDVACGTGVLARAAAGAVGPEGSVAGVDINEGMLAVARRLDPLIDWRLDPAESLPFPNNSFDAVVSQFGLMFFEDRQKALQEMWRVLRPGGHLAVAVWDRLENATGYAELARLLGRHFGPQAEEATGGPFVLGDREALAQLFAEAGLREAKIATYDGSARFDSIESFVHTELRGWTLAETISDDDYARFVAAADEALQPFAAENGEVSFTVPAHIVTLVKPG